MTMYEPPQTETSRLAEAAAAVALQPPAEQPTPITPPQDQSLVERASNIHRTPQRALHRASGILGARAEAPAVDPDYQKRLASLTNKYSELAPIMERLPENIRESLIDYDSARVSRGNNPMTREQTIGAIRSALDEEPATPAPERNPWSLWGNFTSDLSDILASVPRIPLGLISEVKDLTRVSDAMEERAEEGYTGLAGVLQAPGIRMLPGTYAAANVLRGPEGWKELASRPLMTGLDLLPAVNRLAAGTEVAKLAEQATTLAGRKPRPIRAVLTNKVLRDSSGNLLPARPGFDGFSRLKHKATVDGLGRNFLGRTLDALQADTRVGQALDAFGGDVSRTVARAKSNYMNRSKAIVDGIMEPGAGPSDKFMDTKAQEHIAAEARAIFRDYEDTYPQLAWTKEAGTPEMRTAMRELTETMKRNPETLDPGFVSRYRALQERIARYEEAQGRLGHFDGEWFDMQSYKRITGAERTRDYRRMMFEMGQEIASPSGKLPAARVLEWAEFAASSGSRTVWEGMTRGIDRVLDAYGIRLRPIGDGPEARPPKTVRSIKDKAELPAYLRNTMSPSVTDAGTLASTRRPWSELYPEFLRAAGRKDMQVRLLQEAVKKGDTAGTRTALRNIANRKDQLWEPEVLARLDSDLQSIARRNRYHEQYGKKFNQKSVDRAEASFQNVRRRMSPARFDDLIVDKRNKLAVEAALDAATPDAATLDFHARMTGERILAPTSTLEASEVLSAIIEKRWGAFPEIDLAEITRRAEREATRTWMQLREQGADPVFVHRVSPNRASAALYSDVPVVDLEPSTSRWRGKDASADIGDIVVSTRHQVTEMLNEQYTAMLVEDVVEKAGILESDLRESLAPRARQRAMADPSLDFEGHLSMMVRRMYSKFNPEEVGLNWGGARLSKFDQGTWMIPKALSYNLKQYTKPPGILTSVMDPITNAFRFNVLGLSPSVTINNFFSNIIALTAESGFAPWRNFRKAWEWGKDPSKIPADFAPLAQMIYNEHPGMETLSTRQWQRSAARDEFLTGVNSYHAFKDSALADAARKGVDGAKYLAEKNYELQMLGDQVYRAMQFMHETDKLISKGVAKEAAVNEAMEMVRRTLVDYGSFTQVERQAMRSFIPFYSFMSHAAKFVMRYPFDHPMRTAITARIAAAERERLQGLPGSYLSMVPIPFLNREGKQNMLALRPFDMFGDIASLTTVSGWMAASNPVIQTALQQLGVVQGQADLYPTVRYNPDTGRMEAEQGNFLVDLFQNVVPRAGLFTSALGLNPVYNELMEHDPDAARRSLVSMVGIPRAWREVDPVKDRFKTEVARQTSTHAVRAEALKSGDWSEAMLYPSLAPDLAEVLALTPEQVALLQPEEREVIAGRVREALSGGR